MLNREWSTTMRLNNVMIFVRLVFLSKFPQHIHHNKKWNPWASSQTWCLNWIGIWRNVQWEACKMYGRHLQRHLQVEAWLVQGITLFISIIVFCETDNIPHNIPWYFSHVAWMWKCWRNIPWNNVTPTKHLYGYE